MGKKLIAVITDDEEMPALNLQRMLQLHVPAVKQTYIALSALEAKALIEQHQPDLLFLDVEMPVNTGFDLLNMIEHKTFEVIFTTAYQHYSIKAIRYSALDYLLKPIDVDELKAAVDRYLARQDTLQHRQQFINGLLENVKQTTEKNFKITLHTSEGLLFIKPGDIMYCKADGSYTMFYMINDKRIIVSKPLKEYEELLRDQPDFIRPHRSFLVNRAFIKSVQKEELILQNDVRIEIARRRKIETISKLNP
ncbi:MAG: response regulator transcription factor [Bacteroidetes bacterium]|nr:response regulator transcription factor [Bacteroidota bacterium]